jgi:pilus assembly protein CpaD
MKSFDKFRMSFSKASAGTVSVIALLMVGCAAPIASYPPLSDQNAIQIAETVERLELYARPNGLTLSAKDEMAVAQFLQTYRAEGDGVLYVNMPKLPYQHGGNAQTHSKINQMMASMGLPTSGIKTGHYHANSGSPAPVVVSYRRLKIIPEDCRSLGSITSNFNNQPWDGFGCFDRANLAAMIKDPNQLIEPNAMTSPDMQRRMVVYDAYIEGENPASEQPERQEVAAEE